jgi:phage-related minor tail protein
MAEAPFDARFTNLLDAWDGWVVEQASLADPDHEALYQHWVATAQQRLSDGRAADAIAYLEAAQRQAGQGGATGAAERSRELSERVRAETRPLELEEAVPCR